MSQLIKPQIVWTKEKIELLKVEYPKGNNKNLCKNFGISYQALVCAAGRFGVTGKLLNRYKLKSLMEDTLENYYWMGFIMADGYISEGGELKIGLSQNDKNHLQKLATKLNIDIIDKEFKTTYNLAKVSNITCKDIVYGVELRKKMNIVGQKTYNPPCLDFIKTNEQFLSFFAGFADGDACVCFRGSDRPYLLRLNCHGSWIKNFEYMAEKLREFGYKVTTTIDNRGYSVLRMSTSGHILSLRDKFVEMGLPIMERKWFYDKRLKSNLI